MGTTGHIRVSAQKAADSISKFAGELQDALTDAAAAIDALTPETVTVGDSEEVATVASVTAKLNEVSASVDDHESRVKTLEEEKEQRESDITDHEERLKSVESEFGDVKTYVEKYDLDELSGAADKAQEAFDKAEEVESNLQDLDSKFDELPDFDDITNKIEEMPDWDDLTNRLDELEAKDDPAEKIEELETELNAQTTKLEAQAIALSDEVAGLRLQVAEQDKILVPVRALFALIASFAQATK